VLAYGRERGYGGAVSDAVASLCHGDEQREAGLASPSARSLRSSPLGTRLHGAAGHAHDYELAFAAARRCAADYDWDAVVSNMVYVWTGLTEAIGLKYYAFPASTSRPTPGFQYREPAMDESWMRAEEYDELIDDPTAFLLNVWLPACRPTSWARAARTRIATTSRSCAAAWL